MLFLTYLFTYLLKCPVSFTCSVSLFASHSVDVVLERIENSKTSCVVLVCRLDVRSSAARQRHQFLCGVVQCS